MEEITLTGIPATVEQAVETLIEFYTESLPEILAMSQQEFVGSTHYGVGLFIRNSWHLHWYEGRSIDAWPKEKPALVKHFHDLGVMHPDEMSSALVICFYWKIHHR